MTALKGANAAPTSGSIRLVVRELGMARRAERLRVTELGYYSSESRPTREVRRADHRGKPSRCLEYSKGRYPKWRKPQLVDYSPETDTSTGERRAWKLASGVRRGARGKGRCESYLACGLPYLLRGKSELIAENALLRQQLTILHRQIKRPVYKKTDRLLLVLLARMVRTWKQALFLVQPQTRLARAS